MPNYKVTWFFEGLQQATLGAGAAVGWTETWAVAEPGPIDQVFKNVDVNNYTTLRQLCLAAAYRISFLRVTEMPSPGAVSARRTKIASLANVNGALVTPSTGGAQVQCAILVDLMKLPVGGPMDKVHHRKFMIRGLAPDIINGNVINNSAPSYNAYKTFWDFVGNRPTTGVHGGGPRATMLGIAYQDAVNFPKIAMPTITVDTLNSPRLISFPAGLTAFVAGDIIRINGFKGVPGVMLNRAWTLVSTGGSPLVATFGKSRFDITTASFPAPNTGSFQRVRFAVGPLDQYAVIGLRNKRTGKVFHQLRGRSRNRVAP